MSLHSDSGCARGLRLATGLAVLATASVVQAQTRVIYVDDDAAVGGDGASWNTAFRDLQNAISALPAPANPADVVDVEIRIAGGVYRPGSGSLDRYSRFTFATEVSSGLTLSVLGGFRGLTGANHDERNPALFETVLSGDLKGDDTATGNRADNSFTIVEAGFVDSMVFDGVTLKGATTLPEDGSGGNSAMQLQMGVPTANSRGVRISRCRFTGNAISSHAGTLSISGYSSNGKEPVASIEDCRFAGNSGLWYGGGGGIFVQSASVVVKRTAFVSNASESTGAAANIQDGSDVRFEDCVFAGNAGGGENGGVIIANGDKPVQFDRCTFQDNRCADPVMPIALRTGQFRDCIMRDSAASAATISLVRILPNFGEGAPSLVSVERCDVQGGQNGFEGELNRLAWRPGNIDADPKYVDFDGADNNIATWEDNDLRLADGSPCIDAGRAITPREGERDLAGSPRFFDGNGDGVARLDIGAYEFTITPCISDIDGSGFVDTDDFDAFVRAFEAGC